MGSDDSMNRSDVNVLQNEIKNLKEQMQVGLSDIKARLQDLYLDLKSMRDSYVRKEDYNQYRQDMEKVHEQMVSKESLKNVLVRINIIWGVVGAAIVMVIVNFWQSLIKLSN